MSASPFQNSPRARPRVAFVATLGGKPQVITFALDCLLGMGVAVSRVVAVHFSLEDDRVAQSVSHLSREIDAAYGGEISFHTVPVRSQPGETLLALSQQVSGEAIGDADAFGAPDAIWLTIHRLIGALKAMEHGLEMCVTGGPRLLALQSLSAASLLFASHDHCWHLYTPPAVREQAGEGQLMHTHDPRVRLISVPLLPLGSMFPHLNTAARMSPQDIVAAQTQRIDQREVQACAEVVRVLTPRQRIVLREFARQTTDVQAVAEVLHLSNATVSSHRTAILSECRQTWAIQADVALTHHFIRERFGGLSEAFWQQHLTDDRPKRRQRVHRDR
jgi:CRISPR-associated protein Csx14